ncbi:TonB-dependent receptor [Shewanella sp. D64]|uniref:TonB-dependent receptor n=1 Tax=unclassified Shewanella TaxID=196818 RepID=UPI0022BA1A2B|nr:MULTISPECIES: TonB-dependent receptor [unclassified Shewanella]MEC4723962.1 TonB-dependent receptor [Shewanella sp. D64]MEC4735982.1 TonB-dependent receptor [Shewanella sp. E94]
MYAGAVSADSDLTYEQSGQRLYTRNLRVDNDGDVVQDELIKGVTVPNSSTNRPIKNNKSRTAYSAGIQWQPDDSIDLVWDITSTTYDNSSQRHNGQLITNPIWGRTVFDKDAIEIDDNNVLRYADFGKTTGGGGILSRVQDMRFNNDTANLITGINLDWALDNLTTNFDIYYSTVDYSQDLRFPIFNRVLNKNNVVYNSTGNLPTFTTGDDRLDPSGYRYLFSNIREIELDGENYGSTLKFNYLLDTNWLSSFDVGFHYEKTDLDSKRSTVNRLANPSMADEIVDLALTGELTDGEFLSGHDYSPGTWLISDFDTIGELDPRVLTTGIDNLGVDYSASHESTEQIVAAFGQLNIDVYFSDMQLTGNLGVRAVYTKNEATAGTLSNDPAVELNTISNDYWEYLPSLNLNLGMTESTALRLGVSKTLSHPEYSDMAPIIRINIPNCEPNDTAEDCKGTGKSGNPDLEPMTAWNYDLTFEYYNETDGSAVVSLFYKSLKNFIIDDIVFDQTIIDQPEDILFDVTKPVNFSNGEVKGYEIGFYQPFDKLIPALAGFGMSTNYTYVDSSFDEDVGNSGFGFPGTSKNNLNFVGFYENDVFSARVAYLFRDDFFRSLAGQGSQTTDARFTGDTQSLDLNIKIKPTQSLVLALNARNLLDDTRRDHIGDEAKMLDFFDVGRHYSMSITYRF